MHAFILLFFLSFANARIEQASPQALAQLYSLTTSTSFPFPSATESSSDTQSLLLSDWSLAQGRIQDGADNLAFVENPFPNSVIPTSNTSTYGGPVLEITYEEGSYSHDTGGVQLYNLWNTSDGSTFQSMLLSYEVAFDQSFDWVKGGKLPGLRGGNPTGCSGGNEATGRDCFSTRLMWRRNGGGEVYAYIPTPNNLCAQSTITCNSDFGISLSRGSFSFVSGQWNRITLLVQMNEPADVANGNIQLYFNDLLAISQENLQIRSVDNLSIGGLYLSSFFGGSDESWATPETTHTYFRNITLWGGSTPSNLTGEQVQSGAVGSQSSAPGLLLSFAFFLLSLCL